jgi:hypothetical protein
VLGVLVCYFKTHKEGLKEEGLFRKSVSIEEENEMLGELSSKNYDYLLRITNPHLIASINTLLRSHQTLLLQSERAPLSVSPLREAHA